MADYLRPIADTLRTNIASGTWADIDEVVADDGDYVRSVAGENAVYEFRLQAPPGPVPAGLTMLRLRHWKCDETGFATGTGQTIQVTPHLYQGGTLIDSVPAITPGGGWGVTGSSVDVSTVTDWSDLRVRLVVDASAPGQHRSAVFSQAWLEVPDIPRPSAVALMF